MNSPSRGAKRIFPSRDTISGVGAGGGISSWGGEVKEAGYHWRRPVGGGGTLTTGKYSVRKGAQGAKTTPREGKELRKKGVEVGEKDSGGPQATGMKGTGGQVEG